MNEPLGREDTEDRVDAEDPVDTEDGPEADLEDLSRLEQLRLGLLVASFVGAGGAALAGMAGQLLVAAGHLVPWTLLAGTGLVVGALLGAGGRWLRLAVGLVGGTVVASGMIWTGMHSLRDVTLSPGGAEGCHVVVRQSARMKGYVGDVYVRHGRWGVANQVATYIAPDPLQAADFGSYELAWRGVDGRLAIGYLMNDGERSTAFRCG